MSQEKTLSFALICLAISIVIAAVIVSGALRNAGEIIGTNIGPGLNSICTGLITLADSNRNGGSNGVTDQQGGADGKATYDLKEAAAYLGIEQQRVLDLVAAKESGIPYLKFGDFYVFNKNALDKWLETARVDIN